MQTRSSRTWFLFSVAAWMPVVAAVALLFSSGGASAAGDHGITEKSVPADVFAEMSRKFLPEKARGVHARYLFDLSGPNGGKWWITVDDGAFKMGRGNLEKPDVVIATSDQDWVRLSTGSLGGTRAFLTGRLKFQGDRGLAHKLDEFFP